jgi:nitrite reductase/ring-hydroxylating ferredoxin subunit
MAGFVPVCRLDELPEGGVTPVEAMGHRLALYRASDRVYVLSGQCPHAGGPLGFGWVENSEAVCPLHRWHFRLDDGRCTTMRGEWVRAYRSEIRDGEVWVEV